MHPSPAPTERDTDAVHRAALHELITLGTALAQRVHDAAQPGPGRPDPLPMEDAAIAFDRVARAVRRTLLLARQLTRPDAGPPGAEPAERPEPLETP